MLLILALICMISAIILLGALSYIDLKERILPNELVLALACSGFVFHLCTVFHFFTLTDIVIGALIGGGLLFIIREISNRFHGEDTLGLGDVKLMAAGGMWLGPEAILIAITLGAIMGVVHGLIIGIYASYHAKVPMKWDKMSVPAGPGFAVGLILAAIYTFSGFPAMLFK